MSNNTWLPNIIKETDMLKLCLLHQEIWHWNQVLSHHILIQSRYKVDVKGMTPMESMKFHDNSVETIKWQLERTGAKNKRLHQETDILVTKMKTFEISHTSMVTIKPMKDVAPTWEMEIIEQNFSANTSNKVYEVILKEVEDEKENLSAIWKLCLGEIPI